MATREYSPQELTAKAERYCVQAERCQSEIRQKVEQWGGDAQIAEKIAAHLVAEKYIDEMRYASAYVNDKLRYQNWGRKKIEMMLRQKEVAHSTIQIALDGIDEKEYKHVLQKVIQSKQREIKGNSPQEKAKMFRFLMQRGFLYDEIKKILDI